MTNKRKYLQKRPKPGVIYFRHGGKVTRLPSDETSTEFATAYDALLATIDKGRRPGRPAYYLQANASPLVSNAGGRKKFLPPSIGWFLEQWLISDFFAPPDKPRPKDKPFRPGTQYNYKLGIELLRQVKGGDGTSMADLPLDRLTPRLANLYIQKIKRERSGSTALIQKNILSNLWKFAGRLPNSTLATAAT
jgi:hypothetical protein